MDSTSPSTPTQEEQVFDLHVARERAFTNYVGMLFFLLSWAMMFAALFYAYASLRTGSTQWPPDGLPELPVLLPGLSTLVLLASSVAMQMTKSALKKDNPQQSFRWLIGACVLGTVFLVMQGILWVSLYNQGLHWTSKAFGAVFYGFTIFHALHVLVGLGLLGRLVPRHRAGEFTGRRHLPIHLVAMYWNFVDVVWVAMYLSIFVL
ncbi:MAG: cytochrome c oxidase subunit 3 [Myxococcota bacterium]|nr:cytochrome c oxidase subunit 3 [Myxococcota bacterium]